MYFGTYFGMYFGMEFRTCLKNANGTIDSEMMAAKQQHM
jgi:hypothetical protein